MPAAEKKQLDNNSPQIKKLGIIAGGGSIPAALAQAVRLHGIDPFIVAFKGQTDTTSVEGTEHIWARLGAAGGVLKTLNQRGIQDIVIIGAMRRPSLAELRPDRKAAEFFAKYALKAFGDDSFLKALREFLEKEGFRLHGAHRFLPELLAPSGLMTRTKPSAQDEADITRGIEILNSLASLDIGQAAIVQNGLVLGVEAVEGTSRLIERCALLKRAGGGGVLIKRSKTNQDRDLDLPTIGPETIETLHKAGFSGLAIESGSTLVVDCQRVCELADKYKIFIIGC